MYSCQLLDYFENPRNAGVLEGADAQVEVENPVCGDTLRLSLRVQGGRIGEIRFLAKGCVPVMGCASALTEIVKGKSLREAAEVDSTVLVKFVGGLPQASFHASQLAVDALQSLLRQYAQMKQPQR